VQFELSGAINAEGVRQLQPRVASTLGKVGKKVHNSERVGEVPCRVRQRFQRSVVLLLIPRVEATLGCN